MTFIDELPDDDGFWFAKWCDRPGYERTDDGRTVKVRVLIQRLNVSSQAEVEGLSLDTISREILGIPFGGAAPETRVITISVGTIPLFGLGAVFHRKEYLCQLPTTSLELILPGAEKAGFGMPLGKVLDPPPSWTSSKPYFLMNRSEYAGVLTLLFEKSAVFVMSHGDTDYIIPRFEVFRRFFAPCTLMAHALTMNSWNDTKGDLILLDKPYAGLRTEDLGHEWRIILQTDVPDQFARWLAILLFDKFAHDTAKQIYYWAQIERNKNEWEPWHFSAHFPFRAEKEPLRLAVRGWYLAQPSARPGQTNRKKFLVTSIYGSNLPDPIPPIWIQRVNSSDKSDIPEPEKADQPYRNTTRPSSQPADYGMIIDGKHDATNWKQPVFCDADTFGWLDAKPIQKLKKLTHRTFEPATPMPHDGSPTIASTGITTNASNTLPKADVQTIVRGDPSTNFVHLEKALTEFQSHGLLSFHIVAPPASKTRLLRGTQACWSLPEWLPYQAGRRSLAWVMVKTRKKAIGLDTKPYPRAALVLAIRHGEKTGYWIEIEARQGTNASLSTILFDLIKPPESVIAEALAEVTQARGKNLSKKIPPMMRDLHLGRAVCSKHQYVTGEGAQVLSPTWAQRFLRHCGISG